MILDAGTLRAYFDPRDRGHWSAAGQIELLAGVERLVVSPFVIAELGPIIRGEFGLEGWLAVLDELGRGAWSIAVVDPAHLRAVAGRVAAGDGLAEASVAMLAAGAAS